MTRRSLLQALEIEPGNEDAIVALAELLVEGGRNDEALALLERIPEIGAHPPDRRGRPSRLHRPTTTTTPSSPACSDG